MGDAVFSPPKLLEKLSFKIVVLWEQLDSVFLGHTLLFISDEQTELLKIVHTYIYIVTALLKKKKTCISLCDKDQC